MEEFSMDGLGKVRQRLIIESSQRCHKTRHLERCMHHRRELSVLCGVDAGASASGYIPPKEPKPQVWPGSDSAKQIIVEGLPERKHRSMVNQNFQFFFVFVLVVVQCQL